jgi:hypothetical protein
MSREIGFAAQPAEKLPLVFGEHLPDEDFQGRPSEEKGPKPITAALKGHLKKAKNAL